MDEWMKDLVEAMEKIAGEVEQFFQDMAAEVDAAVEEYVEELANLSEEVAEQTHAALKSVLPVDDIADEFERSLREFFEPFVDLYLELDLDGDDRSSDDPDPLVSVSYVPPSASKNPACIGCQNYHGLRYGDNLLICGMHPYGWEGEGCPDWEGDSSNN
jgi:hypothetical protein